MATATTKTDAKRPNDGIGLPSFAYTGRIEGQAFKDLNVLMSTLKQDQLYDFEVYKVHPIKKARYKGIKDSPNDIAGIEIIADKPLMSTRVALKHALEFNGRYNVQLLDEDGILEIVGGHFHQIQGQEYGRYFLLKKY